MNSKPISIVSEHLIPAGKTRVRECYSGKVAKEIAQFKSDIKMAKNAKEGEYDKDVLEFLQDGLAKLQKNAKKVVTTINRYTDSKGAKYVEIIKKDNSSYATGTPVRKMIKFEEETMKDGRRIVTKTIHDKSDHLLMGQGHQDGVIKKVEEFYTRDGVKVARRTTTQQASGYGGKIVEKELSKDGCELTRNNTARTITNLTEDGMRHSRISYETGDVNGTEVFCDKKGISQVKTDAFKYGW